MSRPFLYKLIVLTVIVLAISTAIIISLPEKGEEAATPVPSTIPTDKPLPPDALAGEKLYEKVLYRVSFVIKSKVTVDT